MTLDRPAGSPRAQPLQTQPLKPCRFFTEKSSFQGFSLSLAVANEAEADKAFAALADGGEVRMPLAKTFWSPRFGVLKDRFGIGWMITMTPTGKE